MDVILNVNFHNENCMAVIATACRFCVQQIELLRCQYHLFVTNLYCVLVVFIYKSKCHTAENQLSWYTFSFAVKVLNLFHLCYLYKTLAILIEAKWSVLCKYFHTGKLIS